MRTVQEFSSRTIKTSLRKEIKLNNGSLRRKIAKQYIGSLAVPKISIEQYKNQNATKAPSN